MAKSNEQNSQADNRPAIILVTDTPSGENRGRRAVDAAGARIIASVKPEEAAENIRNSICLDAVFVDLVEDHGKALDTLLEELDRAAKAGRHRSVISVPMELLDIVAAKISHDDVLIVCPPDTIHQTSELTLALSKRSMALQDISSDHDEARLRKLSEEVSRIASALAELSHEESDAADREDNRLGEAPFAFRSEPAEARALAARDVRAMIAVRRMRDRFFDSDLFADPAWDMLLDLMAARLEGRQVAVSSLCIAAAVPPTTALRWIRTMTERGLFARRCDPRDGRRVFIDLTPEAAEALERWFAAARQNGEGPGG